MTGTITKFEAPGWGLQADVPVLLWSPSGVRPSDEPSVLIANDGFEYSQYADLIDYCEEHIASGKSKPYHVALVVPVTPHRNEWYAASLAYDYVMAHSVIPTIAEKASTTKPPIGMGASLGALAMLSCEFRYPGTFGGLFLQSGSFWRPEIDASENPYPEYPKVAARIGELQSVHRAPTAIPIDITCSTSKDNLACNRAMAETLRTQGHDVRTLWTPGAHDFKSWRHALRLGLGALIERC